MAYSNEDDNKEMFYYDERYELELKMKRFNGTHEIHEVVNKQGDHYGPPPTFSPPMGPCNNVSSSSITLRQALSSGDSVAP